MNLPKSKVALAVIASDVIAHSMQDTIADLADELGVKFIDSGTVGQSINEKTALVEKARVENPDYLIIWISTANGTHTIAEIARSGKGELFKNSGIILHTPIFSTEMYISAKENVEELKSQPQTAVVEHKIKGLEYMIRSIEKLTELYHRTKLTEHITAWEFFNILDKSLFIGGANFNKNITEVMSLLPWNLNNVNRTNLGEILTLDQEFYLKDGAIKPLELEFCDIWFSGSCNFFNQKVIKKSIEFWKQMIKGIEFHSPIKSHTYYSPSRGALKSVVKQTLYDRFGWED